MCQGLLGCGKTGSTGRIPVLEEYKWCIIRLYDMLQPVGQGGSQARGRGPARAEKLSGLGTVRWLITTEAAAMLQGRLGASCVVRTQPVV